MSDVDSDTEKEKGAAEGASCPVTSACSENFVDAPLDPPADPPVDAPKHRIPKVTSDSFISELVSDRDPGKTTREGGSAASAIQEEDSIPGEDDVKSPPPGLVLSPSQSRGPPDPQWSNVDLEEAQSHQDGAALDSADTCSLSSVATYTLTLEEPYGADEHPLWAWVSGGGCSVDCHSQLNWFNSSAHSTCELD